MDSKNALEHTSSSKKEDYSHDEGVSSSDDSYLDDDAIERTQPGKKVWMICMTASVGGFLFGEFTRLFYTTLTILTTFKVTTLVSSLLSSYPWKSP